MRRCACGTVRAGGSGGTEPETLPSVAMWPQRVAENHDAKSEHAEANASAPRLGTALRAGCVAAATVTGAAAAPSRAAAATLHGCCVACCMNRCCRCCHGPWFSSSAASDVPPKLRGSDSRGTSRSSDACCPFPSTVILRCVSGERSRLATPNAESNIAGALTMTSCASVSGVLCGTGRKDLTNEDTRQSLQVLQICLAAPFRAVSVGVQTAALGLCPILQTVFGYIPPLVLCVVRSSLASP
eukprot:358302-Chlamydomonas_euryale.AAC.8